MRNLGLILVVASLIGFLTLSSVRPGIVLGWVKRAHPEYAGDDAPLLLVIRMVAAIGFIFMLYFAVLLIHRQLRDDAKCKEKYGKDWEVYRKKVPYRIVPYIY